MTYDATQKRHDDFHRLTPFMVGFDRTIDSILSSMAESNMPQKYPPYNILKHNDIKYSITIAVAGFNRDEISIEYKEGVLSITGKVGDKKDDVVVKYLYKGIAMRDFVHQFRLADEVEVIDAEMNEGILCIRLEKHIPEHCKPRTIAIKGTYTKPDSREFLTEA